MATNPFDQFDTDTAAAAPVAAPGAVAAAAPADPAALTPEQQQARQAQQIAANPGGSDYQFDSNGDLIGYRSKEGALRVVVTPQKSSVSTTKNPFDQFDGEGGAGVAVPAAPETTMAGLEGAATRGLSPVAMGALAGGALGSVAGGIGAIPGAAAGAAAAGLTQLVGDPLVSGINHAFGTDFTKPTDAWAHLLTHLGVAEPKTTAERIVEAGASGVGGAFSGIGAGRTLLEGAGAAPSVARGVGEVLADQPIRQLAGGGAAGIGAQGAAEEGAPEPLQLAAGLAAGAAGARAAAPRSAGIIPPVIGEAEAAGIPVMTSDALPPNNFASKWLQTVGERIPYAGTGGVRAAQQASRVDAVRDLLRSHGADTAAHATENVMADLAAKRSADLGRYSAMKTGVIDGLQSAGTVPVSNATAAIDREITQLQSLKTNELTPVIARLEDWKHAIQDQSLPNIELLRKQIGQSFAAPELAAVRDTGQKALNRIYPALRSDMEAFIRQNGQPRDLSKWQLANGRLAEMAGELKVDSLKRTLRRGDATPEVVSNMLFSQKPSEIRQLYRGLTETGRANARMAILARAAHNAGGIDEISPEKFVTQVKKLGEPIGVFFNAKDAKQIDGLVRALKLTHRASVAGVSPPTGVQNALPVFASALTSILGSFGATVLSGGGIGLAARAYESAPVRNALLRMANTAPGAKEEFAIAKRAVALMAANDVAGLPQRASQALTLPPLAAEPKRRDQ